MLPLPRSVISGSGRISGPDKQGRQSVTAPPGGGDKLAIKHRPDGQCPPSPGFHLAFAAPSRQAVDQFYAAAIAQGGSDNGRPGLRPHYGEHYYAAFVMDPDGYALEAVFNSAE
ncbi:catechol 2,3-dioxygenase-like lactoylglutathione lyase family enzyme [Rhizobium leguminosarum]|nr:catechol 2,3-dioxygenase-like lactoylglutathione lyase family enzyme [Rhizobium leguminosarum]